MTNTPAHQRARAVVNACGGAPPKQYEALITAIAAALLESEHALAAKEAVIADLKNTLKQRDFFVVQQRERIDVLESMKFRGECLAHGRQLVFCGTCLADKIRHRMVQP